MKLTFAASTVTTDMTVFLSSNCSFKPCAGAAKRFESVLQSYEIKADAIIVTSLWDHPSVKTKEIFPMQPLRKRVRNLGV